MEWLVLLFEDICNIVDYFEVELGDSKSVLEIFKIVLMDIEERF